MQDPPYGASSSKSILEHCGRGQSLGIATCLKSVGDGMRRDTFGEVLFSYQVL